MDGRKWTALLIKNLRLIKKISLAHAFNSDYQVLVKSRVTRRQHHLLSEAASLVTTFLGEGEREREKKRRQENPRAPSEAAVELVG